MTHAMLSPDLLDGITDPRKQRRVLRPTLDAIAATTLRVHAFMRDESTGSFVRTLTCPADAKALAQTILQASKGATVTHLAVEGV